jgi:hypothetical protein
MFATHNASVSATNASNEKMRKTASAESMPTELREIARHIGIMTPIGDASNMGTSINRDEIEIVSASKHRRHFTRHAE